METISSAGKDKCCLGEKKGEVGMQGISGHRSSNVQGQALSWTKAAV